MDRTPLLLRAAEAASLVAAAALASRAAPLQSFPDRVGPFLAIPAALAALEIAFVRRLRRGVWLRAILHASFAALGLVQLARTSASPCGCLSAPASRARAAMLLAVALAGLGAAVRIICKEARSRDARVG
jgi:hypothetical protein